ncbi:MAG TPA: hypothetical protein VGG38_21150 [Acidimicrobiales bacterium]
MALGTVAFWHGEDGWGAIEDRTRPGLGFIHYFQIRGIKRYRELVPGNQVEFEWQDGLGQDGCQWRVQWVRPI